MGVSAGLDGRGDRERVHHAAVRASALGLKDRRGSVGLDLDGGASLDKELTVFDYVKFERGETHRKETLGHFVVAESISDREHETADTDTIDIRNIGDHPGEVDNSKQTSCARETSRLKA